MIYISIYEVASVALYRWIVFTCKWELCKMREIDKSVLQSNGKCNTICSHWTGERIWLQNLFERQTNTISIL